LFIYLFLVTWAHTLYFQFMLFFTALPRKDLLESFLNRFKRIFFAMSRILICVIVPW